METPTLNWYRESWTAAKLKRKADGYRALFDREPVIIVEGNWHGPFRGKESPPYSIHGEYVVRSIGHKYIEIQGREGTDHVLPTEPGSTSEWPYGAHRVTFEPGAPIIR